MGCKKSQAALEFLTTYAWAILVILVMIAALSYFGILNISSILPERCNLPAGISCLDFKTVSNAVKLRMRNDLGKVITIQDIEVEGCTGSAVPDSGNFQLKPGQTEGFTIGFCTIAERRFESEVKITYDPAGGYVREQQPAAVPRRPLADPTVGPVHKLEFPAHSVLR